MRIYTVHIKENDKNNLENAIFIKEGFSLWAAVFQGFWALYNRMWLCTAALFFASALFLTLENYAILNEVTIAVLRIGFFMFVGFGANDWYRQSLSKKGYVIVDVVSSNNLLEAKQRFFSIYLDETDNKLTGTA